MHNDPTNPPCYCFIQAISLIETFVGTYLWQLSSLKLETFLPPLSPQFDLAGEIREILLVTSAARAPQSKTCAVGNSLA